jgi:thioredoxin reductase
VSAPFTDVVVVGGGAAGLSAALMLARARRAVTVVDGGRPRNLASSHLHGFLSRDGADPAELLSAGRREVESYGGSIRRGAVSEIRSGSDGEWQVTWSGGVLNCRVVVVATGLTDRLPDIPGLADAWGTSVFHCPYCHGYEVDRQPVAVIGGDNRGFSLKQAGLLTQWSEEVTFYLNGITLEPEEEQRLTGLGVNLDESPVSAVADDGQPGISFILSGGRSRTFGAAFVGPVFEPNDALLRQAGCRVGSDGFVVVDRDGRTGVSRLWSAGNVSSSPAQLITAASQGASVGISVNDALTFGDDLVGGPGTRLQMDEDSEITDGPAPWES